MYLLPCNNCDQSLSVSPAQAGDEVTCSACGSATPVPKLGDLRNLPQSEQSGDRPANRSEAAGGMQVFFSICAMIAVLSFGVAIYCGIRWFLVEVPNTTEKHIASVKAEYMASPAANLILKWEDMEEYGIDLVGAFSYHTLQKQKDQWGRSALYGCGGGVLFLGLALWVAAGISKKRKLVA